MFIGRLSNKSLHFTNLNKNDAYETEIISPSFLGPLGHSFEYRQMFIPSVCTGHPFLKVPAVG